MLFVMFGQNLLNFKVMGLKILLSTRKTMKTFLVLLSLLLIQCRTMAQVNKVMLSKSKIASWKKTTIDSDTNAIPLMNYVFVVHWKEHTGPHNFFYKGQDGWYPCSIAVQHKNKVSFSLDTVSMDEIKKNDILQLTTMSGGRYAIPEAIQRSPYRKALY